MKYNLHVLRFQIPGRLITFLLNVTSTSCKKENKMRKENKMSVIKNNKTNFCSAANSRSFSPS